MCWVAIAELTDRHSDHRRRLGRMKPDRIHPEDATRTDRAAPLRAAPDARRSVRNAKQCGRTHSTSRLAVRVRPLWRTRRSPRLARGARSDPPRAMADGTRVELPRDFANHEPPGASQTRFHRVLASAPRRRPVEAAAASSWPPRRLCRSGELSSRSLLALGFTRGERVSPLCSSSIKASTRAHRGACAVAIRAGPLPSCPRGAD